MKDLFDSAYRLVHTGERCVLAMIRKSSGSTPRGQGAGMLVLEDGSVRCTIGGGFLEWSAVETARNVLKNGSGIVERFELRGVDATVSDAICGGDAEVCYCLLDRRSLPVLERLYSARQDRIPGEFFLVQKGEDVILCCRVSGKTVLPPGSGGIHCRKAGRGRPSAAIPWTASCDAQSDSDGCRACGRGHCQGCPDSGL